MSADFPDRKVWLRYRARPKRLGAIFPNGALRPRTPPGANATKRKIPKNRKARVRLRAHLTGRLHGRPLTAHERSWL